MSVKEGRMKSAYNGFLWTMDDGRWTITHHVSRFTHHPPLVLAPLDTPPSTLLAFAGELPGYWRRRFHWLPCLPAIIGGWPFRLGI